MSAEERFWAKVDQAEPNGCWPWTGHRIDTGYGRFYLGGKHRGTHRVAWTFTYGLIPDGLHVLHRCDNPPCCNPVHLWIGTHSDNMRDMVAKGRLGGRKGAKPGELHHGARLTYHQVEDIRRRSALGERGCDLAVAFGVSTATISRIRNRRGWRS